MPVTAVKTRSLSEIAYEMMADMKAQAAAQKKPISWEKKYWEAQDRVKAISCLNSVDDMFYAESGREIVSYLIGNLQTYRGETAKRLKEELKALIK